MGAFSLVGSVVLLFKVLMLLALCASPPPLLTDGGDSSLSNFSLSSSIGEG